MKKIILLLSLLIGCPVTVLECSSSSSTGTPAAQQACDCKKATCIQCGLREDEDASEESYDNSSDDDHYNPSDHEEAGPDALEFNSDDEQADSDELEFYEDKEQSPAKKTEKDISGSKRKTSEKEIPQGQPSQQPKKTFVCKDPTCGRIFYKNYDLERHTSSHKFGTLKYGVRNNRKVSSNKLELDKSKKQAKEEKTEKDISGTKRKKPEESSKKKIAVKPQTSKKAEPKQQTITDAADSGFFRNSHGYYQCRLCSYGSDKKANTELHINTKHRADMKFKCDFPECTYETSNPSNFKRHMAAHDKGTTIHSSEKIQPDSDGYFRCVPCGTQTKFRKHILFHLRSEKHKKNVTNESQPKRVRQATSTESLEKEHLSVTDTHDVVAPVDTPETSAQSPQSHITDGADTPADYATDSLAYDQFEAESTEPLAAPQIVVLGPTALTQIDMQDSAPGSDAADNELIDATNPETNDFELDGPDELSTSTCKPHRVCPSDDDQDDEDTSSKPVYENDPDADIVISSSERAEKPLPIRKKVRLIKEVAKQGEKSLCDCENNSENCLQCFKNIASHVPQEPITKITEKFCECENNSSNCLGCHPGMMLAEVISDDEPAAAADFALNDEEDVSLLDNAVPAEVSPESPLASGTHISQPLSTIPGALSSGHYDVPAPIASDGPSSASTHQLVHSDMTHLSQPATSSIEYEVIGNKKVKCLRCSQTMVKTGWSGHRKAHAFKDLDISCFLCTKKQPRIETYTRHLKDQHNLTAKRVQEITDSFTHLLQPAFLQGSDQGMPAQQFNQPLARVGEIPPATIAPALLMAAQQQTFLHQPDQVMPVDEFNEWFANPETQDPYYFAAIAAAAQGARLPR